MMSKPTHPDDIRKIIQEEKAAAGREFATGNFDQRLSAAIRALPASKPDRIGMRRRRIPAWTAAMVMVVSIAGIILITMIPASDQNQMRDISRLISESAGTVEASPRAAASDPSREGRIARTEVSWLIRNAYYQIHRRAIGKEELRDIFTRPPSRVIDHETTFAIPETGVDPGELQIEQRLSKLMASGRIESFLNKLSET